MHQYKINIQKAIIFLKQTCPEIFEINELGEQIKIKISFQELQTKLHNLNLIPPHQHAARFTANIKSWACGSMEKDLKEPLHPDEFVHINDLDKWRELKNKRQPPKRGGWAI